MVSKFAYGLQTGALSMGKMVLLLDYAHSNDLNVCSFPTRTVRCDSGRLILSNVFFHSEEIKIFLTKFYAIHGFTAGCRNISQYPVSISWRNHTFHSCIHVRLLSPTTGLSYPQLVLWHLYRTASKFLRKDDNLTWAQNDNLLDFSSIFDPELEELWGGEVFFTLVVNFRSSFRRYFALFCSFLV